MTVVDAPSASSRNPRGAPPLAARVRRAGHGLRARFPEAVHPAALLAGGVAAVFALTFSYLSVRNHNHFGTWSFDMGIYDQGFWLTSRFTGSFVTVRGLEFWGQHVNLIVYAFVPFYWFGAGPAFLCAAQATVVGLGAVPTYLIARDRLKSPWIALAFASTFVMYAPVEWLTEANFHPEALVITPLLFAWWFARRGRWRPFFVAIVIALSTREDVALVVTMLGLVLIVMHWRGLERDRKAAWWTLLLGGTWYAISTKVFIPHFNRGEEPFYIQYFYSEYGKNMRQVVGTIVRHPNRVISAAVKSDRVRFYRDLLLPWGALSLGALPLLLMIAPQMVASVIGTSPYARQIRYQYTSVMLAPIIIAAIEGARFISRRLGVTLRIIAVWMLLCAAVSNVAWSPSPWGDLYRIWSGPPRHDRICQPQPSCDHSQAHHNALRTAIRLVPTGARIAATYAVLPHLAHRKVVFDWPNPFRPAYWGNNNENLPDPGVVQYLVLDRLHIGPQDQPTLAALTAPGGEFEVLLDQANVLLAHRVRPPTAVPVIAPGRTGIPVPANATTLPTVPILPSPAAPVPPSAVIGTAATAPAAPVAH